MYLKRFYVKVLLWAKCYEKARRCVKKLGQQQNVDL